MLTTLNRYSRADRMDGPVWLAAAMRWMSTIVLMRCRLCWRLTTAAFLSILAIEAIILLPSYRNYERDRIVEYCRATLAAVKVARRFGDDSKSNAPTADVLDRLIGVAGITGLLVITDDGTRIGQAGLIPEEALIVRLRKNASEYLQLDRERLLVELPRAFTRASTTYAMVATTGLDDVLRNFVFRVIGLVGLIAAVVTITTMLVLRFIVLAPVVSISRSMTSAAAAPHEADGFLVPDGAFDELATLTSDANHLLRSTAGSLRALRDREQEIMELNASLERRVAERTAELEKARLTAEAGSRAKSEFLANMSHELRTPLNAIMGFSEVMSDELMGPLDNPHYREYSQDILKSARHLLRVIDDILDLSLIETGQTGIADDHVCLDDVLEKAITRIEPIAGARNVRVKYRESESPVFVRGDGRRLRQIAVKLLSNAVKFTPAGKRVEASISFHRDGAVAIKISDEGIGIPEDQIKAVMQPFSQIASVISRDHQGIGLGLPLVNHFIRLHGGHLEIFSRFGEGTTVFAWLPHARVQSAFVA